MFKNIKKSGNTREKDRESARERDREISKNLRKKPASI